MKRLYIIYMAAGNSRRFGSNKLLYEIDGKPIYMYGLELIDKVIHHYSTREDVGIFVTVVTRYDEIIESVKVLSGYTEDGEKDSLWDFVYSKDSHLGLSYTIKAGIEHITDKYGPDIQNEGNFVMFMVGDQPYLTVNTMARLIDEVLSDDFTEDAAGLCSDNVVGNPCVFKGSLIPEFRHLKDDEGGKKILKGRKVRPVMVSNIQELYDIDEKTSVIQEK